jgi:hypothetical protein
VVEYLNQNPKLVVLAFFCILWAIIGVVLSKHDKLWSAISLFFSGVFTMLLLLLVSEP